MPSISERYSAAHDLCTCNDPRMQVAPIMQHALAHTIMRGVRAYDQLCPGPPRLAEPLREHPSATRPVVLVPGYANDAGFLDVWQRSLRDDGFEAFTFDDPAAGMGDVRSAARNLASFVAGVRARTGAALVDVVTYSAGNTVTRAWMSLEGGAPQVDSLVVVDGSWRGDDDSTLLAVLHALPIPGGSLSDVLPPAFHDLQRTSSLCAELARLPQLPAGVRVTSIYPERSAGVDAIDGARNIALADNPGHLEIARRSASAYVAIRSALLSGR